MPKRGTPPPAHVPALSSSGASSVVSCSANNSPGKRGLIPVQRPFDLLGGYGRPKVPRLHSLSPNPYEQVAATDVVEPPAVGLQEQLSEGVEPTGGSMPVAGSMPAVQPSGLIPFGVSIPSGSAVPRGSASTVVIPPGGSIPLSGSIPSACVDPARSMFLSLCPVIPCRAVARTSSPLMAKNVTANAMIALMPRSTRSHRHIATN
jgi:hypothetical protein